MLGRPIFIRNGKLFEAQARALHGVLRQSAESWLGPHQPDKSTGSYSPPGSFFLPIGTP
jgi:hypothetical protein